MISHNQIRQLKSGSLEIRLFSFELFSGSEWVIGSLRRECLNHMIILGERHLKRILSDYVDYCNGDRTHLTLEKDAPDSREDQSINAGRVVAFKRVGGLHHFYLKIAA